MEIMKIIIGVFIIFGTPILASSLAHVLRSILNTLEQLVKQTSNLSNLREVEVKLLNQGSETSQIPPPKGSMDCSHTWETVSNQILETDDEKKLIVVQVCKLCGLVDKTIETVEKKTPRSECIHKWARQAVILKSAFQQAEDLIRRNYSGGWSKKDLRESKPWFYKTKYVCTLTCDRCGEVKTIIASNVDAEEIDTNDEASGEASDEASE